MSLLSLSLFRRGLFSIKDKKDTSIGYIHCKNHLCVCYNHTCYALNRWSLANSRSGRGGSTRPKLQGCQTYDGLLTLPDVGLPVRAA
jgi:hypothetical protein